MTIRFFPLGIPISGSFVLSSSFATTVPTGGLPNSASVAEYVINSFGPTGSIFTTVSASIL